MTDKPDPIMFKYRSSIFPVQFLPHPKTDVPVFSISADFVSCAMNQEDSELCLALFVNSDEPMPNLAVFSPMDKPTAERFIRQLTAAVARMAEPAKHDDPIP
jgi:hypothetical protein